MKKALRYGIIYAHFNRMSKKKDGELMQEGIKIG